MTHIWATIVQAELCKLHKLHYHIINLDGGPFTFEMAIPRPYQRDFECCPCRKCCYPDPPSLSDKLIAFFQPGR